MTTATTDVAEVDGRIRTMRHGFTGVFYAVPAEIDGEQRAAWQLERSHELGATALQIASTPTGRDMRLALAARARVLDIELEGAAPSMFVPLGVDPETTSAELRDELIHAKEAGLTVVRSGYGALTVETSRFARERNLREQLDHVAVCLARAGRIAEEVGVPVAVENHCDFSGRELASVLADVASEWVGCALDTANGFSVFCDPNDDVEALAEFAFTTHIKDMRMEPSPSSWLIPLQPKGCLLGEGHVDVPRAIRLLAERSPRADNLHLIAEPGWESFGQPGEPDDAITKTAIVEDALQYLRRFIDTAQPLR